MSSSSSSSSSSFTPTSEPPLKKQRTNSFYSLRNRSNQVDDENEGERENANVDAQDESSAMKGVEEEKSSSSSAAAASSSLSAESHFNQSSSTPIAFSDSTKADLPVASHPVLYRDVIHCVMQFMEFDEFHILTQINSQWKSAVKTLKPVRKAHVELDPPARGSKVNYRNSALLPHVSSVNIKSWSRLGFPAQLNRLAVFPHLESIEGMDFIPNWTQTVGKFNFPSTLTNLQIRVRCTTVNKVLNAVSELVNLKKFDFEWNGIIPDFDFSPLLKCTQLTDINYQFERDDNQEFDSNTVDARLIPFFRTIHQMPSLRRINFGKDDVTIAEVRELAKKPNQLKQVEWIPLPDEMEETEYQVLLEFPHFTDLSHTIMSVSNLNFLLPLTHLKKLDLAFNGESNPIPPASNLMQVMAHLTHLQDLYLMHDEMTSDELAPIVKNLPVLDTLTLACMHNLESIENCFNSGTITQTLTSLEFSHCPELPVIQMSCLRSLTRLTSLKVSNSFDGRLCELARSLFQPDSSLLIIPTLKLFEYDYLDGM